MDGQALGDYFGRRDRKMFTDPTLICILHTPEYAPYIPKRAHY